MDGRSFAAVVLSGVLTGSELTSWGIVHPTLWKLDHAEQVRAEKLMYRPFASVDPFLMTATIVACFLAATGLRGADGGKATEYPGQQRIRRDDVGEVGAHAGHAALAALSLRRLQRSRADDTTQVSGLGCVLRRVLIRALPVTSTTVVRHAADLRDPVRT